MSAAIVAGCTAMACAILGYWVGWVERGEHEQAMRNIDRLAELAERALPTTREER